MNSITLQQFLELIRQIAYYLIPVVGLIILIYIARVLHRLTKVVGSANERMKQLENTIDLVDENLVSLTSTTKSIASVAHSVDSAHLKSKEKMSEFSSKVNETIQKMQSKGKELIKKNKNEEVEQ